MSTYTYGADGGPAQRERAGHYVTTALSDALIAEVTFADRAETYQLLVVPPMRLANQAVEALSRAAPCLALALLAFSLLCAVGYSRYLARPIVRISSIAGRMAELDFQWKCGETRRDEIGALGRSLDEMAERLSAALAELEEANAALRGDMERARELERQRLAFFSAASHELKTPVTILKGQLSGMLDGVGVYRDREKHLARSLQVAGRMEALVGELLAVSRMESDGASRREAVELSALTAEKLAQDAELLEQRGMTAVEALEPGLLVEGERPAGPCGGKLALQRRLYSPWRGRRSRDCGGPGGSGGADSGKHRGPHPGRAAPTCLRPFTGPSPPAAGPPAAAAWGSITVRRMIVERHGGRAASRTAPTGCASPPSFRASPQKTHKFSLSPPRGAGILGTNPNKKGCRAMQITLQELNMTYPNGKKAFQGVSASLDSPSLIGLLGPNGAGKSTLMKLLVAGLLPTGEAPYGRTASL